MFIRRCSAFLSAVVLASAVSAAEPRPGREQEAKLEARVPVTLDYLLFLPKDYEQKDSWPLLLFLHGAGERGSDLELVKTHGPPKIVESQPDFPFIVVSPQCPKDEWWEPFALLALLDDVSRKYKVDPDRVSVTGLSMGGFGTWALAARAPNRFAAIVPICGGGERFQARRLRDIPVWVFHGAKDEGVPLDRSEEMVEAVRRAGGDARFTVYPNAAHDSWTETYNNPELYEWLLKQKRGAKQSK